ncbi:hypothetical protein N7481_001150 [Penicillium waksmanii]|uniref:uncharacterized protein n=1 Tax=Penicillium waksmanii TaxID=69791 RepID=UPI0025467B9D|nr:uncharacterized protein N7481_001150 [Penicillium waksmanii]KAJ6000741.1 hypothetical protein N7481_001150 [Penicillium waksmanii]
MSQPVPSSNHISNENGGALNFNQGRDQISNPGGNYLSFNNAHIVAFYENTSPRKDEQKSIDDDDILKSLAFPKMTARRDDIEACHENTCRWILVSDKYLSWKSCPRGILWIKGKPGAGKSTVMAFLYGEPRKMPGEGSCESTDLRLGFFFTALETELQRSPLGMLRSLLNQIFYLDASVRPQIRDAFENRVKPFGSGEQQWEWPRRLLEELLTEAILASARNQPLTIFVDALDEVGEKSAQQLADYFHRLNIRAEKCNLKICISCRHYPIVNHRGIEITVENHNHDDITCYVKDLIHSATGIENDSDPESWWDLTDDLIQQANGVFQWVHIILPIVRQKINEGDSPRDIRDWLPEVPIKLEDVYRYILTHIIKRENREQSFWFLQWVCLAERPMTLREMRYAMVAKDVDTTLAQTQWSKIKGFVEKDDNMKQRAKALSGGLAEIVPDGSGELTIRVVHQSVKDFLRTKGLAFLRNPPDDKQSIDMEESEVSHKNSRNTGDIFEKSLINKNPLLNYATINLFVHAEKAGSSRVGVISNEIPILKERMKLWVLVYQQIEGNTTACPAIGTTLLHMASAANMVDVINTMCSNGSIINKKNAEGRTAMHFAASRGHMTAAKMLCGNGADLDTVSKQGETPLVEAASHGHRSFVEWLLNLGVDINKSNELSGTALQSAVSKGRTDLVHLLVDVGADVDAQGGENGNALQIAAACGSIEIVQLLLDFDTNVHAKGGYFGNALQAAAHHGNTDIVQKLLDAGVNVNAKGGHFGNALQAAASDWTFNTVEKLLEVGADFNAQGGCFGNALQAAASNGSIKTVERLLNAGANVHAKGGHFGHALQAAAYHGSTDIVKRLLCEKPDVNAEGGCYGNALQAAASSGSIQTVEKLLEAGADFNAQGGCFGNALQAAAYYGSTDIVQILLDAGAIDNR